MVLRGFAGYVIVLSIALAAPAQDHPRATQLPDCLDQPTQYPSLLRPPAHPDPPLAVVPRGPVGEYDHGHLYLPDYVPPSAPEACRPLGRWWISPSFEFAWLPSRHAPVNVRLRVPIPDGGSISGPVLPIAGQSADSFQAGFGLTGGWWFNDRNTRGVDASFFTLGGGRTTYGFAPDMLVLFPDGAGSAPQLIVFPPNLPIVGVFPVTFSTWFVGADVNYRHNVHCWPHARLDLLLGYRFAALQEELVLGETSNGSNDDYRHNRLAVTNPFHGGQVGVAGEYRGDRWYVNGAAKVALGAVSPELCATGLFRGAEGYNDGYSALTALTESGRSRFAVLPTMNLQVGRQLGDHARLFAGYSFQYLNEVVRLGDVLDPAAGGIRTTDFWIQSLGLGFELRY